MAQDQRDYIFRDSIVVEDVVKKNRMQLNPSEYGRSVVKSTPTWDHGQQGIGRGTNFRGGVGDKEMAQTEHPSVSLRVATRICSSRALWMGLTRTAGGRIGSEVEGSSRA